MFQRSYPNYDDFHIFQDYNLEKFMEFYKAGQYILVPRVRTDKTIFVSKKLDVIDKTIIKEQTYENLFWLIQLN